MLRALSTGDDLARPHDACNVTRPLLLVVVISAPAIMFNSTFTLLRYVVGQIIVRGGRDDGVVWSRLS